MRILLLLAIVAGCGGGDSGTSKQGIYRITTWTRNGTACDAEGPSVASTRQPFFYIKNESFLGVSFVNVNSCDDVATCKTEANDGDTIHLGGFTFEEGSDASGWTTHNAFGFQSQGQCRGGVTDGKLTFTGTQLRIEQRHVEAVPFAPSTGEDECPDDKVEQAAAGQPCDELEVVTAEFDSKF